MLSIKKVRDNSTCPISVFNNHRPLKSIFWKYMLPSIDIKVLWIPSKGEDNQKKVYSKDRESKISKHKFQEKIK